MGDKFKVVKAAALKEGPAMDSTPIEIGLVKGAVIEVLESTVLETTGQVRVRCEHGFSTWPTDGLLRVRAPG